MHPKIHKNTYVAVNTPCGHFMPAATADLLTMRVTAAGVDQRYWKIVKVNQECRTHTLAEVQIPLRYLED